MRRDFVAQAVCFCAAVRAFVLHAAVEQPQLRLLQVERFAHFGDGAVKVGDGVFL